MNRMIRKLSAGSAGVILSFSLAAAPDEDDRVRRFAELPQWRGIWETLWSSGEAVHASGRLYGGNEIQILQEKLPLLGHPPYNTEWEARYQLAINDTAALMAAAASAKECRTSGFPMAMSGPQLLQFVITPEETLVVFDSGEVRHIYTDGRNHPAAEDLWPTRMGDSIGYWQDDTLVIDTVARTEGAIFPGPVANLSAAAHFTERLRLIDADTIESRMTIEDPERLARPWEFTLRFTRVRELDRMIPWDCENDRNPVVDGKLIVTPAP